MIHRWIADFVDLLNVQPLESHRLRNETARGLCKSRSILARSIQSDRIFVRKGRDRCVKNKDFSTQDHPREAKLLRERYRVTNSHANVENNREWRSGASMQYVSLMIRAFCLISASFEKLRGNSERARCIPARNKNAGRLIPFIDPRAVSCTRSCRITATRAYLIRFVLERKTECGPRRKR